MKQALRSLAMPDPITRVLVATAYLHTVDPPVTAGKVNDLLTHLPRRNVEQALRDLAALELVEIQPGRPRPVVPAVRLVHWADPRFPVPDHPTVHTSLDRRWRARAGCSHRLLARWGSLCMECGEIVDGIPTAVYPLPQYEERR